MENYTKGEWKAAFDKENRYHIHSRGKTGDMELNVCVLSVRSIDETDANARLIAAAPELYEALKELIRRDDYGSIRLPTQARDVMLKAIAKVDNPSTL